MGLNSLQLVLLFSIVLFFNVLSEMFNTLEIVNVKLFPFKKNSVPQPAYELSILAQTRLVHH